MRNSIDEKLPFVLTKESQAQVIMISDLRPTLKINLAINRINQSSFELKLVVNILKNKGQIKRAVDDTASAISLPMPVKFYGYKTVNNNRELVMTLDALLTSEENNAFSFLIGNIDIGIPYKFEVPSKFTF